MASPKQYSPEMFYNAPIARTWASTGNTDSVTDINITANVSVVINHIGSAGLPAGLWRWTVTPTAYNSSGALVAGTIAVTSSASETAGLTYNYKLV